MAKKTVASAAQIAANWQRAMISPATADKYKAGIQRVTVSPTSQAASPDAQNLYVQRTQAAVSSGRMAAALNAVSLQTWQQQALGVGATRLSTGAQKGQQKQAAAAQKWQAVYQQASDAAQALPKGGMSNAMARVQAALSVLMQAKGTA